MKIPPLKIFCVRHYTYEAGDLQESFTEYDKLGQNFAESEHVLLTIGQLKLSPYNRVMVELQLDDKWRFVFIAQIARDNIVKCCSEITTRT